MFLIGVIRLYAKSRVDAVRVAMRVRYVVFNSFWASMLVMVQFMLV